MSVFASDPCFLKADAIAYAVNCVRMEMEFRDLEFFGMDWKHTILCQVMDERSTIQGWLVSGDFRKTIKNRRKLM